MEEKLEAYRAKQRRIATFNKIKNKFFNMLPFQQNTGGGGVNDNKSGHVFEIINEKKEHSHQELSTQKIKENSSPISSCNNYYDEFKSSDIDEASTILPFTDSEDESTVEKPVTAQNLRRKTLLLYFTWFLYFSFWATCWAIAIQLQFGTVYLVLSGILGMYFNTRTEPKKKDEVSAYSVFNKDCQAIDGSLNADQFDKEIRYGPTNLR